MRSVRQGTLVVDDTFAGFRDPRLVCRGVRGRLPVARASSAGCMERPRTGGAVRHPARTVLCGWLSLTSPCRTRRFAGTAPAIQPIARAGSCRDACARWRPHARRRSRGSRSRSRPRALMFAGRSRSSRVACRTAGSPHQLRHDPRARSQRLAGARAREQRAAAARSPRTTAGSGPHVARAPQRGSVRRRRSRDREQRGM